MTQVPYDKDGSVLEIEFLPLSEFQGKAEYKCPYCGVKVNVPYFRRNPDGSLVDSFKETIGCPSCDYPAEVIFNPDEEI